MKDIQDIKKYLLTVHPVRRTSGQKAECRQWILRELKRAGWRPREETYGKLNGSVNIVAGDPDRANVFLCTHYDTASRMLLPDFVSPTNVAAHVAYHFTAALLLAAAAFALALAVSFPLNKPELMLPLFLILAVAGLWLAAYGPANQANANGGHPGGGGPLAPARAEGYGERGCLVFLDHHLRKPLGASAFQKRDIYNGSGALFSDMACAGGGEHLLLLPSKHSRWDSRLLEALEEAFPKGGTMEPHLRTKGLHYYPSDNRKFKFHVVVCACRHLAGLGYYIPHLRTRRDTALDEDNIAYVAEGLARFLPLYLEQ